MKKSVFTTLNYYLPAESVMPMHCSANVGPDGDVALFFGLSGTGKTTLSADPNRTLIGDDEHGWGPQGVFNFEGGCYAKCIKLSAEAEPEIYATTKRFGTVLENVVFDPETRICDFDDDSKTENTRAAYPLEFIPNASRTGRAGMPKNIVLADRRRLRRDAADRQADAGAGDVSLPVRLHRQGRGHREGSRRRRSRNSPPASARRSCRATLPSTAICLRELISAHEVDCWLVNTGWTGGIYGVGRRMPIKVTRTLLTAALDGSLKTAKFRTDPYFGFSVPTQLTGVEPHLLYPQKTWQNKLEFDETARKLVDMFQKNFVQFEDHVEADVRAAAPEVRIAAE